MFERFSDECRGLLVGLGKEEVLSKLGTLNRLSMDRGVLRIAVAVVSIVTLLLATWVAGRAGVSRLLSNYGKVAHMLEAEDQAVRLAPSDPAAYQAHALMLFEEGELIQSIREFERAVALRPSDYVLWLGLGRARDLNGDKEGALAALREAVRLAPYYAPPRWQLGSSLLGTGRRDEAFTELRRAAASDPALFLNMIDLAWGVYKGDANSIKQATQPQTPTDRLSLARFFARHGKPNDAMALFHAANGASADARRSLVIELLAAKRFNEAYEVWESYHDAGREKGVGPIGLINDGKFEHRIKLDDPGFGWQIARDVPAIRVLLDKGQREGANSLRVDYNGYSNPATPVISQLVLVEANARYQLHFTARSEHLVANASPVLTVTDISGEGRLLTQSPSLPQRTDEWLDYQVEFATGDSTSAVLISVQRQNCSSSPCSIFGQLWLNEFSLKKL